MIDRPRSDCKDLRDDSGVKENYQHVPKRVTVWHVDRNNAHSVEVVCALPVIGKTLNAQRRTRRRHPSPTSEWSSSTCDLPTNPRTPQGCLIVQSALACGDAADSIRKELASRRDAGEAALRRRFQRAKRERDLPANADPADLARYITTVVHGMAVKGAGSATRQQLLRVMQTALQAWPA